MKDNFRLKQAESIFEDVYLHPQEKIESLRINYTFLESELNELQNKLTRRNKEIADLKFRLKEKENKLINLGNECSAYSDFLRETNKTLDFIAWKKTY